jgi:glycosyltransferase involved in cell wall biosynthesis
LPPLEAMSSGKPLLLSNIPGHKELIDESHAGLIFVNNDINDFFEKLEEILEKNQFYSSNALEYASRNDWSITCKKISNVYEQIMNR